MLRETSINSHPDSDRWFDGCQVPHPFEVDSDKSSAVSGVVLLFGAPGSGKTLLGRCLEKNSEGKACFLSIGEELRALGLVDAQARHPTAKRKELMCDQARQLLESACRGKSLAPSTCSNSRRTLILEAVKDIHDAYSTMRILEAHNIPLLQALLLPGKHIADRILHTSHGRYLKEIERSLRDSERQVAKRQSKWNANAAKLIEYFSSRGVLSEVGLENDANRNSKDHHKDHHRTRTHQSTLSMKQIQKGLAGHGYSVQDHSTSQTVYPPCKWIALSELCPPPGLCFISLQWVTSPRLVTQPVLRDQVLSQATQFTGLHIFVGKQGHPWIPVPKTSVVELSTVEWIAVPGRYSVSRKCDGTRYLLIVAEDGATYFLNRLGSLFRYPTELGTSASERTEKFTLSEPGTCKTQTLEPGTVLDGELVWIGDTGFFLAFDAISVGSERVWQRPLSARLSFLNKILVEAESCDKLRSAASHGLASSNSKEMARAKVTTSFMKKQQAPPPGKDTICILRKQHLPVSTGSLEELMSTRDRCPYPEDGLIFTPNDMLYALGMTELTFKWQPKEQISVDLSEDAITRKDSLTTMPGLVYECVLSDVMLGQVRIGSQWRPLSIRWDKAHPNAHSAVTQMQQNIAKNMDLVALIHAVHRAEALFHELGTSRRSTEDPDVLIKHPAVTIPFHKLYAQVNMAVQAGTVEKTKDFETGLEIFNYLSTKANLTKACELNGLQQKMERATECGEPHTISSLYSCASREKNMSAEMICRGLILDPSTQTVVAMPFVRFDQCNRCNENPVQDDSELPEVEYTASVKVDGSLIIAFRWQDKVLASTRRRMDSEQALWASRWLHSNARLEAVEQGWTYLFEAVYSDNTVVVPYFFESLILLGAVAPTGFGVGPHERCRIASRLGVMAVPFVSGFFKELTARNSPLHSVGVETPIEKPVSLEGWIITVPGDNRLKKLVQPAYKRLSQEGMMLHPLTVWDRIRCGGRRRESLKKGLQEHMRREINCILEALEAAYCGVLRTLQLLLLHAEQQFVTPDLQEELHCLILGEQRIKTMPSQREISESFQLRDDQGAEALSLKCRQMIDGGKAHAKLAKPYDSLPLIVHLQHAEDPTELWKQHMQKSPTESDVGQNVGQVTKDFSKMQLKQSTHSASDQKGGAGKTLADSSSHDEAFAVLACAAESLALPTNLPGAFIEALQYVLKKGANSSDSMYYQGPTATPQSLLRIRILDCIRPGLDGSLPGYTPSQNFKQTWAKGWTGGPKAGRLAADPGAIACLDEALIALILESLEGSSMMDGLLVCRQWSMLISSSSNFLVKRSEWHAKRRSRSFTVSESDSGTDYHYYREDYLDYGYGSDF